MDYDENVFKAKANIKARRIWLVFALLLSANYGTDVRNGGYPGSQYIIFLILCLCQMPSAVSGKTETTVVIDESGAIPVYDSASSELAERLFTFDARLAPIKLEYVDFKINRNRTADEWGKDIGRYNFKLFGCKRAEKNIVLN